MKRDIFIIPFAAIFVTACSIITKSTQVPTILNIRTYIDGRSQLIIMDNALYWHHLAFDAPGRWEFAEVSRPTYLNQVDWEPTWPDIPDSTNDFCNCNSSLYRGIPNLARTNQRVWLDIVQGRGRVFVTQHPNADNGYTLIVELDDNTFEGAAWYDINLNYIVGRTQAGPISTLTPASVEPPLTVPLANGVPTLASISGTILYESSDPFLRVYAREVDTGKVYWTNPGEGNRTYTIPDLPPGTYVIVGWFHPMGASGAYTTLDTIIAEGADEMRACEEAIVYIELAPGMEYTGADIGCWGGDFFGLVE